MENKSVQEYRKYVKASKKAMEDQLKPESV